MNLGDVIAKANNPDRRMPFVLGDPARMTDQDLESMHADLAAQVVNISRQLDDDRQMNCSRGDAWRRRAMGARRAHLAIIDRMVVEGRRRRLAFVADAATGTLGLNGAPLPPADAYAVLERKRQAREQQAVLEAENARRRAERLAKEIAGKIELARVKAENDARLVEERTRRAERKQAAARRQERLFVDAAVDLLGVDAGREIWARAREMHPDPAIWADLP